MFKVGYEVRDDLWFSAGFNFSKSNLIVQGLEYEGGVDAFAPDVRIQTAAVTLEGDWDTRSDQFYPRGGWLVSADINISDTALGSDTDYVKYKLSYNGYRAIGERNTLAWRLAGETVTGNPPFFAWPWYGSGVDLRGYTPGTYIGKSLLAAQAEWRWQATFRLGLVAFAGVGGSYGKVALFNQDNFLPAGGLGLRWRLTKQNRVNFRIDYAWGKDDEVLLISAGEAF
jgi:outer membrane protein assembly factor BamA